MFWLSSHRTSPVQVLAHIISSCHSALQTQGRIQDSMKGVSFVILKTRANFQSHAHFRRSYHLDLSRLTAGHRPEFAQKHS